MFFLFGFLLRNLWNIVSTLRKSGSLQDPQRLCSHRQGVGANCKYQSVQLGLCAQHITHRPVVSFVIYVRRLFRRSNVDLLAMSSTSYQTQICRWPEEATGHRDP